MMIHKRRVARVRRLEMHANLRSLRDDLRYESEFEQALAAHSPEPIESVFRDVNLWGACKRTAIVAQS
jgi:hypothetical protein